MRIAVAGGTGVVGGHVVRELEAQGHDAVVLARSLGVDLTTGAGLDDALNGVGAVIDVSNTPASRSEAATAFFAAVTTNLQRAEASAGVAHHVALSIVGIDRVPIGYYEGKLRQEQLCLDSNAAVPATILRATQFHEFSGQLLASIPSRLPLVPAPVMRTQTVAAREVAQALVAAALAAPAGRLPDLAGPEKANLSQLVRRLLRARGRRSLVLPLRVPGRAGRAMADGSLIPRADGPRGTQTFEAWLASDDAREWINPAT
ncbi:MAG TPA: NAD-dependent epimerase/dehydratase family protein [Solirubrobacteraceae bacterium]|nr:NAD-dependent epimerase/dehydratase family protein [Solirubrobacteraceae bacterium]